MERNLSAAYLRLLVVATVAVIVPLGALAPLGEDTEHEAVEEAFFLLLIDSLGDFLRRRCRGGSLCRGRLGLGGLRDHRRGSRCGLRGRKLLL